jgi:uncharacterized protein (DUF1684 family)
MTRPGALRRLPLLAAAAWLAFAALAGCETGGRSGGSAGIPEGWAAEVEQYRADREERLRAETGWLSLAGLFWLEPGENAIGSDPGGAVVLPPDAAPRSAGVILYDGDVATLVADEEAGITLDGNPVSELRLENDVELRLGRLHWFLIARGGRHAIRVKDPESPVRTGFHGLDYYPVDPAYRVEAHLRRFDRPRELEVATATGTPARFLVPGVLEFELAGEPRTLEPLISEPDETELFIIFKDATSGRETYGAGRYLYTELDGDRAVLDFNRAYNPPCAFTPFATCPLPPPGNRLDLALRAGEKAYSGGHRKS